MAAFLQILFFIDRECLRQWGNSDSGYLGCYLEKRLRWLLPLALLIVSSLFFIGGPDATSPLVFYHLWNLGHVAFFFILVLCISRVRPLMFWRDWLWMIIAVLLIGAAIEFIQHFIGRSASVGDVLNNLYGVLLALSICGSGVSNRYLLASFRLLSVFLLLPSLWLVSYSAYADFRMRTQFPVINDFESSYELQQVVRIGSTATRAQSPHNVTSGDFSLAVNLSTDKYSGVKWIGRFGDWSRYEFLVMDVYNASDEPFNVTLKIADLQHDMGENLITDRFNRSLALTPGNNKLRVTLTEVRGAPANRSMHMGEVSCLELFSNNLKKSQTIYIDHVHLE